MRSSMNLLSSLFWLCIRQRSPPDQFTGDRTRRVIPAFTPLQPPSTTEDCFLVRFVTVLMIILIPNVIQDVPGAMSTWTAVISLSKDQSEITVLCTGESQSETSYDDDLCYHKFSHTSFVLPMSTFALAIGQWSVASISDSGPQVRFIGKLFLITQLLLVKWVLVCALSPFLLLNFFSQFWHWNVIPKCTDCICFWR